MAITLGGTKTGARAAGTGAGGTLDASGANVSCPAADPAAGDPLPAVTAGAPDEPGPREAELAPDATLSSVVEGADPAIFGADGGGGDTDCRAGAEVLAARGTASTRNVVRGVAGAFGVDGGVRVGRRSG